MPSAARRIGWWALVLIVIVYGTFAISMGVSELLFLLGLGTEAKHRAAPIAFTIHALTGAIALFIGPAQSIRWIRRRLALRQALGRTYVVSIWIASVTAVLIALSFDVGTASKVVFIAVSVLWFATTTIGMLLVRTRHFARQHEWMIRSYSLSLFVVSFSIWVPLLAQTSLPPSVSHPLALFVSGALNLAIAEFWIRRSRAPSMPIQPAARVAA